MKYLHLIWAALFRRKTRTILTLLSIIMAFLLFGMLFAVGIFALLGFPPFVTFFFCGSLIDLGRVMKMPFEGLSLLDYAINASLVISSIAMRKEDRAGLLT